MKEDTNVFLTPESDDRTFWQVTPEGEDTGIVVSITNTKEVPETLRVRWDGQEGKYQRTPGNWVDISEHPAGIQISSTSLPVGEYCWIEIHRNVGILWDAPLAWTEQRSPIQEAIFRGLLASKMPSTDLACVDVTVLVGQIDSPPVRNAIERAIEETENLNEYSLEITSSELIVEYVADNEKGTVRIALEQ